VALLEVNLRPGERDLRWFGVVVLLFCAVLAAIAWRGFGSLAVASVLAAAGVLLSGLYYLVPPLRRLLYVGWMRAVFPIGWVLSHALMGIIYFGVLTPIGLLLKVAGRDPLRLKAAPEATTWWVEKPASDDPDRYFRQF
jgi:hypothetical protein